MGAVVSRVTPGSVAARYGFLEKDEIITINGQLLRDVIDYYFLTSDDKLEINYLRDGLPRTTVIHKKAEETLGLDFDSEVFDGIIPCRYKCKFCFVNQMPRGLRPSLYIHDDDYRLSFLHGNYITLTTLSENDMRRITAMRLSPLYVSVHATDPDVRAELMGSPSAGNIMKMLNKLKTHDIQFHAQVVVIPGINDGKVLKNTLQDLYNFIPTVKSVAIVPVGVTKFLKVDKKMRPFKEADARHVFELVEKFQKKALQCFGYPLFYLSDEIYILLGRDFPRLAHYGFFPQLGNGVGGARKFITDFNRRKRFFPKEVKEQRSVGIVTGVLGAKVIEPLVDLFKKIKNLHVELITVENKLFGPSVTVTGLLSGKDIVEEINKKYRSKKEKPDLLLLPDVLLHGNLLIDDLTPGDIEKKTDIEVEVVPPTAEGLIEGVLGHRKKIIAHEDDKPTKEAIPSEGHRMIFRGVLTGDEPEDDSKTWWEEPAQEKVMMVEKITINYGRKYRKKTNVRNVKSRRTGSEKRRRTGGKTGSGNSGTTERWKVGATEQARPKQGGHSRRNTRRNKGQALQGSGVERQEVHPD